jgi:hypothetical protein
VAARTGRTVRDVLAMDAVEFDGWCAYYALSPFGARQETLHAGTVATAAASAFGGSKLGPADFFPSLKPAVAPAPRGGFRKWAAARCPALANAPRTGRNAKRVAH